MLVHLANRRKHAHFHTILNQEPDDAIQPNSSCQFPRNCLQICFFAWPASCDDRAGNGGGASSHKENHCWRTLKEGSTCACGEHRQEIGQRYFQVHKHHDLAVLKWVEI